MNRTVETGPDGAFGGTFQLSDMGQWSVEASWEGDPGHLASASQPQEFTVVEADPATRTGSGEGSGVGIPGFPFESVMIGLLTGASIILASRLRRYRSALTRYENSPFPGPRDSSISFPSSGEYFKK